MAGAYDRYMERYGDMLPDISRAPGMPNDPRGPAFVDPRYKDWTPPQPAPQRVPAPAFPGAGDASPGALAAPSARRARPFTPSSADDEFSFRSQWEQSNDKFRNQLADEMEQQFKNQGLSMRDAVRAASEQQPQLADAWRQPNRKWGKKEWGGFLFEFGLNMLASEKEDFASAFGEAGLKTMEGRRQRVLQDEERARLSRSEGRAERAESRADRQIALQERQERRLSERGNWIYDENIADAEGNIIGYDRETGEWKPVPGLKANPKAASQRNLQINVEWDLWQQANPNMDQAELAKTFMDYRSRTYSLKPGEIVDLQENLNKAIEPGGPMSRQYNAIPDDQKAAWYAAQLDEAIRRAERNRARSGNAFDQFD